MKIRWIGEPRSLTDPQVDIVKGDEIEVDTTAGKSLVAQGLAEAVPSKTAKKEND